MRAHFVSRLSVLVVTAIICVLPKHAFSQGKSYKLVPLYTPPAGESFARGLNNIGDVAGRSGGSLGAQTQPFVWGDGKPARRLATPLSDEFGGALGINDGGEIVGSANADGSLVPFLWTSKGEATRLGLPPGDNGGQAFAINNSGEIAGYVSGSQGVRAAVWRRNASDNPGVLPGAEQSRAFDINDSGEVVGMFAKSGKARAALWLRDGRLQDLGTLPGDIESEAIAINNSGDVVGYSTAPNRRARAFLWTRKEGMRALGFLPGGDQSRALDINDSGEVVGTSTSSLGERAFVWTHQDGMRDLNIITPQNSGIHLTEAQAINSKGQVVVFGVDRLDDHNDEGPMRLFLLTPGVNSK